MCIGTQEKVHTLSDTELVVVSADQQVPFHSKRMVTLYFKVIKALKPSRIWLAGDHVDFPEYGRWNLGGSGEFINQLPSPPEGDGMLRKVFENAKDGKDFFEEHRTLAPDADITVALGNHEDRIWNYFDKKDPSLLEHITPQSLWGLTDLGIKHINYRDRPLHMAGGFHMHHGVAISKHGGESVKADVDNFGVSLIRGHSHRQAVVSRTYPLRNETVTGIELGHMMDINCSGASYDNVHNWQAGFVVGYIESGATETVDGLRFHPQLIPITQDFTCVVNGRVFKA